MNFGILMIQGLVNSFGTAVMAAFAAAVKIDSFAYMPVQEFGNAFSTFIAQNFGAKRYERIRRGVRSAFLTTVIFSLIVSVVVFVFAEPLMLIFVHPSETEILATGVEYLRIEGAFYYGIGILFLLYGYYRAIRKPGDVGRAYGDFVRYPRRAFLYTRRHSFHRGNGHLVGYSHRLATGGCGRSTVL